MARDPAEQGLLCYIAAVAEAVGADTDCASICPDPPAMKAYIATDEHHPGFPEQYLALLWDEEHGWAVALETAGAELIVLTYLGVTVLPSPATVAGFLYDVVHTTYPGQPRPPRLRTADQTDALAHRLARYADP